MVDQSSDHGSVGNSKIPLKKMKSESSMFLRKMMTDNSLINIQNPWYYDIPLVVKYCVSAFLFPFQMVILASDLIISSVIIGFAIIGWLWWTGDITDQQILTVLKPIGQKILSIVQAQKDL